MNKHMQHAYLTTQTSIMNVPLCWIFFAPPPASQMALGNKFTRADVPIFYYVLKLPPLRPSRREVYSENSLHFQTKFLFLVLPTACHLGASYEIYKTGNTWAHKAS